MIRLLTIPSPLGHQIDITGVIDYLTRLSMYRPEEWEEEVPGVALTLRKIIAAAGDDAPGAVLDHLAGTVHPSYLEWLAGVLERVEDEDSDPSRDDCPEGALP